LVQTRRIHANLAGAYPFERQGDFLGGRMDGEAQIIQFPQPTPNDDPERMMAQRQIIHLVDRLFCWRT
jgi:hypothetical protein